MIGAIFVKFYQLILMKIIKIVATRCQILRLKCTKFNVGCGFAPDPAGGAYGAPSGPLAGFKGPNSKRRAKGKSGRRKFPSTFFLQIYTLMVIRVCMYHIASLAPSSNSHVLSKSIFKTMTSPTEGVGKQNS